MIAPPFLQLRDVVLPPPLPAVLASLIVAGIAYLGRGLARRLRKENTDAPPDTWSSPGRSRP
jgi:hypothetical protein